MNTSIRNLNEREELKVRVNTPMPRLKLVLKKTKTKDTKKSRMIKNSLEPLFLVLNFFRIF